MTRAIASAVMFVAGCSGLDAIETATPTCGNGIIEVGEDCDSPIGCRQCGIECVAGMCEQPGFACGVDGLCHAPSGRFRSESSALPFQVLGYGATDVDADGYNDVVALSGTSLTVHHGDALGKLDNVSTTIVPFIQGSPAVTNLDPGATLDIVIPTRDGLVAYTSRFQTMSPYPFPIELDTSAAVAPKPLRAFTLDTHYLALLVDAMDMTGAHSLGVFILDGNQRSIGAAMTGQMPTSVCAGFAPGFEHDHMDVYDTATSHLIALAGPTGALCLIELVASAAPSGYTITGTHVPTTAIMTRPVLARLGVSPCPSVVGRIGNAMTGAIEEYPATGAPGSCGVAVASPRTLPNAFGAPRGHVPLKPTIANHGPDAIAYQGGVVAIDTTTAAGQTLFITNRGIAEIHALDVDGDGDLDAVTSAEAFDDLDVLYRYSAGGDGFLAVSVDTVGIPLNLLVGDFDGDGIGDMTYTEKLAGSERLMVAYGSRDQVHAPEVVSTYAGVIETGVIELASSVDPTGRVLDMFVLDSAFDKQGHRVPDLLLLSVLLGSPQRTLTPFYDPGTAIGTFVGAVGGAFGTAADGFQHLFNIQATFDGYSWLTDIEPNVYGAMSPGVNGPSQNVRTCGLPGPSPTLCLGFRTRFIKWRPDPKSAIDLVFGIDDDAAHNVIALDPTTAGGAPIGLALGPIVDASLHPRDAQVGDVDGDGLADVILGYGSDDSPAAAGRIVVCSETPTLGCTELVVAQLAGWACVDATPAQVTSHHLLDPVVTSVSTDLAVLCRKDNTSRLFHVFHDAAGYHAAPLLDVAVDAIDVQLVDVNGDGVQDVLVRDAEAVLHIYPQCTSREEHDCADPATLP